MPGLKQASIKVMDNLTRVLLVIWRKNRFESRGCPVYLSTEQKGTIVENIFQDKLPWRSYGIQDC
jgi:hypothetical protein